MCIRDRVSVHVTWITSSSWHFFTGSPHLTQGFTVICNICKDDQYMHIMFICKIFSCCKRKSWRDETFNSRVIRKIQENHCPLKSACALKVGHKVLGFLIGDTHCSKYYCEWFICAPHPSLSCDLKRYLIVR